MGTECTACGETVSSDYITEMRVAGRNAAWCPPCLREWEWEQQCLRMEAQLDWERNSQGTGLMPRFFNQSKGTTFIKQIEGCTSKLVQFNQQIIPELYFEFCRS